MRRILLVIVLSALVLTARAVPQSVCPDPGPVSPTNAVRELRLGVVCYGGVSLAIYMYGTTRELHNLVLASKTLEVDASAADPVQAGEIGAEGKSLTGSAFDYYQLLSCKWKKEGVRTRVVVDIISGTSAGGINGIILAKAIATNGSIDHLRTLWFEEADFVRLAGGRPWKLRALWRLLHNRPALDGDRWLRKLYESFAKMDELKSSASTSLLPPGAHLDLLVTSTDFYGSPRVVEVGDPPTSHDKYHNQVFHFEYPEPDPTAPVFTGSLGNATLAFAARSSASFPVAFPPTSLKGLTAVIPEVHLDGAKLARNLFRHQLRDRGNCPPDEDCGPTLAHELFLVDGGVLDNYPLGIAFQRVGHTKPSSVPAQRVFLYLEPDPSAPPPEGKTGKTAPKALQMLLGGKAGIPGNEPIAGDFEQLARHNERVDRILDLLAGNEAQARSEASLEVRQAAAAVKANWLAATPSAGPVAAAFPEIDPEQAELSVAAQVEGVVQYNLGTPTEESVQQEPLDQEAVAAQRKEIEAAAAAAQAPLVEEAYIRLRVHSVLDQLARDFGSAICGLPEDYVGPRASLARAIVFQWAKASCLKESSRTNSPAGECAALPRQELDGKRRDFLAKWDVGYLRRNLRFTLAWVDNQAWIDSSNAGTKLDYQYGLTMDQLQRAHDALAKAIQDSTDLVHAKNLPDLFLHDPAGLAALQSSRKALHDSFCVEPSKEKKKTVADQANDLVAMYKRLLDQFMELLAPKLTMRQDAIRGELFNEFVTQTKEWDQEEARREVLARYLGFPYWDRVAYPYTAFSGTGDLTHATVWRLSPRDADSLSDKGAERLFGSQLAHFGAFRHRGGREKREYDYLWGRLDGAERLSKLVNGSVSTGLFSTILNDETKAKIPISAKVLSHLRGCVEQTHKANCDTPIQ